MIVTVFVFNFHSKFRSSVCFEGSLLLKILFVFRCCSICVLCWIFYFSWRNFRFRRCFWGFFIEFCLCFRSVVVCLFVAFMSICSLMISVSIDCWGRFLFFIWFAWCLIVRSRCLVLHVYCSSVRFASWVSFMICILSSWYVFFLKVGRQWRWLFEFFFLVCLTVDYWFSGIPCM